MGPSYDRKGRDKKIILGLEKIASNPYRIDVVHILSRRSGSSCQIFVLIFFGSLEKKRTINRWI